MQPFFIKSCASKDDWLIDLKKEICFVGRSNVGKSSLINALANQKIAKTSNTPGRTQLANFYDFNHYRIVDLPGYGYANVNKQKQFELSKIISDYINLRQNIFAVFQIIDILVITDLDIEILNLLNKKFKNHFILLNKIDKVSKSYFYNNKIKILKKLEKNEGFVIPISSKKNLNINFLKNFIDKMVK